MLLARQQEPIRTNNAVEWMPRTPRNARTPTTTSYLKRS